MLLRDLMTHDVETLPPSASLQEAAQKMESGDLGAIPVCENRRLVGIVTDRDIAIRGVAHGCDPKSTTVGEAMSSELIYCFEDQEVQHAARLMEQRQIRRLPVLDRQMNLAGIVSLGDLSRQMDERKAGHVLEGISQPNQPHA
jgi:CBS domain-containing protein